jgi:hypothetical protein
VKEQPSPLESKGSYLMRRTPLVVQFSHSRSVAAPHLPQAPDQQSNQDQPDSVPPAKDDIVGWPDEILIDFAYSTDLTLDSAPHTSL